ncbi:MAG: 4Fe-4S single cluster domain-containing protein [Candidatus Izemoplasmatales bacterium]|nr:4Fe-4S single cluster domain-containing protein [Candidatus Izemoplasmatales bacterium]
MNVAKIVHESRIYGPGARTVIWFQGCSIKCEGCINPDLIPFIKRKELSINDLIGEIKETGVTLLGGEPLDQIDILDFMLELKKKNIQIVLFTGYEWNDITEYQQKVISGTCQFAVLGPFDENRVNPSLYLRGSDNQDIKVFDKNIILDEEVESYEIVIDDSIEVRGRVDKNIFDILEEQKSK